MMYTKSSCLAELLVVSSSLAALLVVGAATLRRRQKEKKKGYKLKVRWMEKGIKEQLGACR